MITELTSTTTKQKILYRVRSRARKRNIECTLSISDIPDIPEVCPILGLPLFVYAGVKNDQSVSIDRIDNTKGYVPGNVQIISWRANRLKNDGRPGELIKIGLYTLNKLKELKDA